MDITEFITPSLNDIDKMLSKLVRVIKKSGFKPDILLGISRGGLIPVSILSDRLGVKSEIVRAEYYCGVKETKDKPMITQPVFSKLNGKKVLIVDDVADLGHSLELVKNYVLSKGAKEIKVCTLHYKPWSIVKPEYFFEETKAWVIYPWEVKETVTDLFKRLKEEGLADSEIRDKMERKGIPRQMIEESLGV